MDNSLKNDTEPSNLILMQFKGLDLLQELGSQPLLEKLDNEVGREETGRSALTGASSSASHLLPMLARGTSQKKRKEGKSWKMGRGLLGNAGCDSAVTLIKLHQPWLPAQDQAGRNSHTDGEEALQAPPTLY